MNLAFRLAWRELRGGLRGFRIFLACLTLGVAVIAAIGSVRASIEAGLKREGATMLGGQAEMEFTYRFANDTELQWMQEHAVSVSKVAEFRSMAVVGDERGLTQVKAVDDAYPLVGQIRTTPALPIAEALAGYEGRPGAIMHREIADRLGLRAGSLFSLGTQEFVLTALLDNEPDAAASGFALGPRTIVSLEGLKDSGLLAPGTLYSTRYRLELAAGTDLQALSEDAQAAFQNSGMRWTDARNGAPGIATFVERLGAFLVLVGLSGLAVGGVGVSAAVRAYLATKVETIAILRTLGAERRTIFSVYMLLIGALAALGIVFGLILGGLGPVLLGPLIAAQLPFPAVFSIYPSAMFEAAIYGALTAFIFTLWPLARTERIKAAALFRDFIGSDSKLPAARFIVLTVAALALLVGLAAWFSGSAQLTIWTAIGLASALVVLALAASVIRYLARRATPLTRGRSTLRWAVSAIGTSHENSTPVILSLGLGLSVLAAIGQIDGNMRLAISSNLPDVAPSYFFVDIQKSQMPEIRQRLSEDPQVSRLESAPMLRGVITKINGKPAMEVAGDHWVIQGDRGVSYAGGIPEGTKITAGEWWPDDYDGPPLISFAAEEGEELGLQLGDTLTVNILGRDFTAAIASFREVDFSNAGMGFILLMNESTLSRAPHSFIATVYAEPEAEARLLRDLAGSFPNITAIRMRDAIDRVSDILRSLASATGYGAAATLLTGFLVLLGTAAAGEPARRYEAALLKTLGASRTRILSSFALRSAMLGACAGLVALAAGVTGAWAVSTFVFETDFQVIWSNAIAIITGGVLSTLLAGLIFAWGPLSARPARILRARD
jgi:putative ABC transport system permease protein